MAATLPPINKPQNESMPSYGKPRPPPGGKLDPLNSHHGACKTRREQHFVEKNETLRTQLPTLLKRDISKFRNSYKHNLCLDMLTDGYHLSFCELTNLIKQQNVKREAAGPESFLWTRPVLTDQTSKLDTMKHYLTRAEAASRAGKFAEEYKARYQLAQFLKGDEDDTWLVDHFFNTCLEVAMKMEGDEGKMQAEGHCNVGLCLQNNRSYKEAARHFEAYHKLAKEHGDQWQTASGTSYYTDSCVNLYNIYTILGNELAKSGDEEEVEASIDTLKNALQMAKDSKDRKLEGEASYTLGMAFQKSNQLDTALAHLFNFYESCQGDSNSEGIGRACDAIAKSYARQGNKDKSVEFLKRFVELTEKTGLEKEYCLACHNLGNVCNSVGNYDEATEYFSKAYNISRALGDTDSTSVNRVQYGIAMAHRMMGKFANHVVIADKTCMARLVGWKSVRTDDFSKAIPDAASMAGQHVVLPPAPEEKEKVEEEPTKPEAPAEEETESLAEDPGVRSEGEGQNEEELSES